MKEPKESYRSMISLTHANYYNDEVFSVPRTAHSPTIVSKKPKPVYDFDDNCRFVCQRGIFSYDFQSQKAHPVYKFSDKSPKRFSSFDFGPRKINHAVSLCLVSYESKDEKLTKLVISENGRNQVLVFPEFTYSQIYLIDIESRAVTFFSLTDLSNICAYVEVSVKLGSNEYEVKNLLKLDLETSIERFYIDSEKHQIFFIERHEETFEVLAGRINRKSEQLLDSDLIRL
jgi:hypothetical protein